MAGFPPSGAGNISKVYLSKGTERWFEELEKLPVPQFFW
jgi:hypothetical protein